MNDFLKAVKFRNIKCIVFTFSLVLVYECHGQELTQDEVKLIESIGFDTELMKKFKIESNADLLQLPAIDQETGEVLEGGYEGIFAVVAENLSPVIVHDLKESFNSKGYQIFTFTGDGYDISVAVIKSDDNLEILKYRRTDGINYDLDNKAILEKIVDWNNQYGLTILGCGRDWLDIEFDTLPKDLDEFAKEVYEFCPDSVDQGVGDVASLKELIKEVKGLWLWWD